MTETICSYQRVQPHQLQLQQPLCIIYTLTDSPQRHPTFRTRNITRLHIPRGHQLKLPHSSHAWPLGKTAGFPFDMGCKPQLDLRLPLFWSSHKNRCESPLDIARLGRCFSPPTFRARNRPCPQRGILRSRLGQSPDDF